MRKRVVGMIYGLALALLAADTSEGGEPTAGVPRRASDIVCGPRCLQYLLKFFRPDSTPDLLEIVSKVQPEFEKGSSLAHLEQYLNGQGLHTLAIEPVPNTVIRWPYPVLLHLSVVDDDMGHYVVLLPESDRSVANVWSGLTGRIRMPSWQLAERIGGGALLISPDPIETTPDSFPTTTDATLRRVGWLAILLASPIVGLAWFSALITFRPWAGRPGPSANGAKPSVPAVIGNTLPTFGGRQR